MTDAKELKIMALKEVISRDKTQYEDQIADLRVELTQVSERAQEAEARAGQLQQQIDALAEDTDKGEVVQGELVEEEEKPARATKRTTK